MKLAHVLAYSVYVLLGALLEKVKHGFSWLFVACHGFLN